MNNWIGRTVVIDGEGCEVVSQKAGPLLTDTSNPDVKEWPIIRTTKLKVKPPKGRSYWLPPIANREQ